MSIEETPDLVDVVALYGLQDLVSNFFYVVHALHNLLVVAINLLRLLRKNFFGITRSPGEKHKQISIEVVGCLGRNVRFANFYSSVLINIENRKPSKGSKIWVLLAYRLFQNFCFEPKVFFCQLF